MREPPESLPGYGPIRRYAGSASVGRAPSKRLASLDAAIAECGLADSDTVSFHHHLRNGDGVLNAVMDAIARRGLRDIHVAATSIFPVHAPLVAHMRSGVVGRISSSFISGPVGAAISRGALSQPVVLRTHGGRARALDFGEMTVDVAFVAAPAADEAGNVSGRLGRAACGTLGYPLCDVEVARHVVAVTDTLAPYPIGAIDIPQHKVDHVVVVDAIGDPGGIASGATRPASDAISLQIGETAALAIAASGVLVEGFSFQTGAGGVSLSTAAAMRRIMTERGVVGGFAAGGVTGFHVEMLKQGLFHCLLDVQCFDLDAVASYQRDPRHQQMSAAMYAGPHVGGAVVDRLSAVALGAAQVDRVFNVNVTTRSDGVIMGGSGGHADTASGAALTVITTRLTAAGYPKIVDRVGARTTPGETIDLIVTEAGVTANPRRPDLIERLSRAGLPLIDMEELLARAEAEAPLRPEPPTEGRIVAISEYRDGSVTDVIRQAPEA